MPEIRNSNLLYRPSVSTWTARKLDRTQTANVNEAAGAVEGAARVNKQLLPDCAELLAVQKFQAGFRNWIYASTLPWDDGGARIGQVARHMEFMTEVGDRMREFDELVEAFLAVYAVEREKARFTLNHMYNAADYPGVDEVRGKFRISLDVMPLPAAEDFRIVDGITSEEAEKLVATAEANTQARIKACMDEAYERLFTVVAKMATTLAQYSDKSIKKFNDTLMTNVQDLVKVMPALNISGDPRLAALTAEAKGLLAYDIKELRKDDHVRAAAIAEAQALVDKFNAIMGRSEAPTEADNVGQTAAVLDVPPDSMAGLFADLCTED